MAWYAHAGDEASQTPAAWRALSQIQVQGVPPSRHLFVAAHLLTDADRGLFVYLGGHLLISDGEVPALRL